MDIVVRYRSIDGGSKRGVFKTLDGARKFAQKWVGRHPEIGLGFGEHYAVSDDGVGKVTVDGVDIHNLFPEEGIEVTHMQLDTFGGEDTPVLWLLVRRDDGRFDVYARTMPDSIDDVVAAIARTGRMDALPHPSGFFGPIRFIPAHPGREEPVIVDSPGDATPISVVLAKGPGAVVRHS